MAAPVVHQCRSLAFLMLLALFGAQLDSQPRRLPSLSDSVQRSFGLLVDRSAPQPNVLLYDRNLGLCYDKMIQGNAAPRPPHDSYSRQKQPMTR